MKSFPKAAKTTNPIGMCIVALVFIFWGTLYFLITSPMWQKTITSGQYEDVYIGQSKIDILKQLKSYSYRVERQSVSTTVIPPFLTDVKSRTDFRAGYCCC